MMQMLWYHNERLILAVFPYDDLLCVLYYDLKRNSMRYVNMEGIYPENRRCYMSTIYNQDDSRSCGEHNMFVLFNLPNFFVTVLRFFQTQ